ncbi:MAG: hypothetical protein U0T82_16345 [Bacteroidales bacterium]
MENNELQKIWKSLEAGNNQKSREELNLLLASKTSQTIYKLLAILGFSILVCLALLIFLFIAMLNRPGDLILFINNITLGLVTVISLVSAVWSWYKIQGNRYNQPLKNWLEERITLLSKGLYGRLSKLYIFLIPFLYVLVVLSIHVYFENKSFMEVLHTEESLISLLVGAPVGLVVAYVAAAKIRKYQKHHLEFLRDLHARLCQVQ